MKGKGSRGGGGIIFTTKTVVKENYDFDGPGGEGYFFREFVFYTLTLQVKFILLAPIKSGTITVDLVFLTIR